MAIKMRLADRELVWSHLDQLDSLLNPLSFRVQDFCEECREGCISCYNCYGWTAGPSSCSVQVLGEKDAERMFVLYHHVQRAAAMTVCHHWSQWGGSAWAPWAWVDKSQDDPRNESQDDDRDPIYRDSSEFTYLPFEWFPEWFSDEPPF